MEGAVPSLPPLRRGCHPCQPGQPCAGWTRQNLPFWTWLFRDMPTRSPPKGCHPWNPLWRGIRHPNSPPNFRRRCPLPLREHTLL